MLYEDVPDRVYGTPGAWRVRLCDAPACGAVWLDPRPDRATIGEAYRNYYTHEATATNETWMHRFVAKIQRSYWARVWGYDTQNAGILTRLGGFLPTFHPGLRAYLDFAVMYLPAGMRGRMLDVGCGDGHAIERMSALGWQVHGVDTDVQAVKLAQSKGLDARPGALHEADWADTMDAVTLSHVIEHVHDPIGLLKQCWGCLKPGGRLVVVTPNVDAWMHRRAEQNWLGLDPPRHLCLFTASALADAAKRAGFCDIRVRQSVREANVQYIAAKQIAKSGRYGWRQPVPLPLRLAGQVIQYLEPTLMAMGMAEGEELVLTAKR